MAETLTRGHKKRARTFEDLLDAAARVFSRKDAILTTFLEIADEARVASGTVHNYFKSKDELIDAAAVKLIERMNALVWTECQLVEDPALRLAMLIKSSLQLTSDDHDWGRAVLRLVAATDRTSEKLTNRLPLILEEGRKSGRMKFRDPVAAQILVGGSIIAAMRCVSAGEKPGPLGEHLSEHMLLALGLNAKDALDIAKRARPVTANTESVKADVLPRRSKA